MDLLTYPKILKLAY